MPRHSSDFVLQMELKIGPEKSLICHFNTSAVSSGFSSKYVVGENNLLWTVLYLRLKHPKSCIQTISTPIYLIN